MSDSSRQRVRRHRQALRKQGLRPVQIWLPDTRTPEFAEEMRREALAINAADEKDDVMTWIEEVAAFYEDDDDDNASR